MTLRERTPANFVADALYRRRRWIKLTRGLPAKYIIRTFNNICSGVDYIGCTKERLADTVASAPVSNARIACIKLEDLAKLCREEADPTSIYQ